MNTNNTHYQSPDVSRVTLQELPLRACWPRPTVLWVDVIGKYSFMAVPSSGTRDPCPRPTPVGLSCLLYLYALMAVPSSGTREPCPRPTRVGLSCLAWVTMAAPDAGTRDPCPRLTPVSLSCLSICTHGNASPGTQEPCPATHLCGPVMSIDAGSCQLEAPPDLLSKTAPSLGMSATAAN